MISSRQTREPMWAYCWARVTDIGSTLSRHWVKIVCMPVSSSPISSLFIANVLRVNRLVVFYAVPVE